MTNEPKKKGQQKPEFREEEQEPELVNLTVERTLEILEESGVNVSKLDLVRALQSLQSELAQAEKDYAVADAERDTLQMKVKHLEAQNGCYRQALEFYADKANWRDTWKDSGKESADFKYFYRLSHAGKDMEKLGEPYHYYMGMRARAALGKIRNEKPGAE